MRRRRTPGSPRTAGGVLQVQCALVSGTDLILDTGPVLPLRGM